jgi:hypothetical protein
MMRRWIGALAIVAALLWPLPVLAAYEFEDITCETSTSTGIGAVTLSGESGY